MVQLNTTYDKTLHERIFVLKEGEGYAKTTDCIAELVSDFDDCNSHILYYRVGLIVDVLRAEGDGFIQVYNNDTQLLEIPWSVGNMPTLISNGSGTPTDWNDKGIYWIDDQLHIGISSDTDSGLFLGYEIPYNLKVKYTGNKQCMGSSSETIDVLEEVPPNFVTSITATTQTPYSTSTSRQFTFTLNADVDEPTSFTVKVYVDDVLKSTVNNVEADEPETVNITGLTKGEHIVKFAFEGTDSFYPCEANVEIASGYTLKVDSIPETALSNVAFNVVYQLLDGREYPVSSTSLGLYSYDGSSYTSVTSKTTDTNGKATFQLTETEPSEIEYYAIKYNNEYTKIPVIPLYTPTSLGLTASPSIISLGTSSTITATPSPSVSLDGLSVIISYLGSEYTVPVVNGVATKTIDGNGIRGNINIECSIGAFSEVIQIEDVYQYLSVADNMQLNRDIKGANLINSKVSNGYKLEQYETNATAYLRVNAPSELKNRITFDIIQTGTGKIGINSSNLYDISIGSTIEVYTTYSNGSYTHSLYIDDTLVKTVTDTHRYVNFYGLTSKTSNSNQTSVIDNIKVKKA